MTVYIDNATNAYGRMKMSHMLADTLGELHAMAGAIGIKRKWFQPLSHPHYDICQAKRTLAIECGAIAVTCRELVPIKKILRRALLADQSELEQLRDEIRT